LEPQEATGLAAGLPNAPSGPDQETFTRIPYRECTVFGNIFLLVELPNLSGNDTCVYIICLDTVQLYSSDTAVQLYMQERIYVSLTAERAK
jgi:hypothetical protein